MSNIPQVAREIDRKFKSLGLMTKTHIYFEDDENLHINIETTSGYSIHDDIIEFSYSEHMPEKIRDEVEKYFNIQFVRQLKLKSIL